MNMNLEYSVLMSVYYKEKPEYLEQAIESMICQTYQPEQFVIVEDGELTVELYDILNKYSLKYKDLITRVKLSNNNGLGIALDEGLKHCRNELVARMDSDDISFVDRCEKEIKLFEDWPELSIVSGFVSEFIDTPEQIVSVRTVPEKQEEIKKRMRTRSAFNHPAVMYRKSEVIRCGGYGILKRKQDHDLFSRMINGKCNAYNIQESILYFRVGTESLKRKKSWENCMSYMEAQINIYRRGECRLVDLIFVCLSQIGIWILPTVLVDIISRKLLRKAIY